MSTSPQDSNNNPTPEDLRVSYQLGAINATLAGIAREQARQGQQMEEDHRVLTEVKALLPVVALHEARIGSLERHRWVLAGGTAVVVTALTLVVPLFIK